MKNMLRYKTKLGLV